MLAVVKASGNDLRYSLDDLSYHQMKLLKRALIHSWWDCQREYSSDVEALITKLTDLGVE